MVFSEKQFENIPTVEEILNSNILYSTEHNGYLILTILACNLNKKILKTIQKAGNIEIDKGIYQNFFKSTKCFNWGEINDYLTAIKQPEPTTKFKIKDILNSTNTWNTMLIERYDLMNLDIRDEIE